MTNDVVDYLNIDIDRNVRLTLQDLIGESVGVLGIKGTGKTFTAAVLIEEFLANHLPVTIVDIEGEYYGLREAYNVVVIGQSPNVDIPVGVGHAPLFARYAIEHGVSLVLDVSDFSEDDRTAVLLAYFNALWVAASKSRVPHQIILEEAHEFVPQSKRTPLKEILTRIALRGRKRGLGIVLVSQRSAKVDKDLLSQASIRILHRVVHPTDMKVYQEYVPLPARKVETMVGGLKTGDAIVVVNDVVQVAHIRLRHTYHASSTPQLDQAERHVARRTDDMLLTQLRELVTQPAEETDTRLQDLESRLIEKERVLAQKDEELAERDRRIEELLHQVEVLSRLTVTANGQPGGVPFDVVALLPSLDVEQLHAATLTTGAQLNRAATLPIVKPELPGEVTPVSSIPPQGVKRGSAPYRQWKRFEQVLMDLTALPRFQRSIVVFLEQKRDESFSVTDLARWLSLSKSTIEDRPPLKLVQMGVLSRVGRFGRFEYRSSLDQYLAATFPALDTEQLKEYLLQEIE